MEATKRSAKALRLGLLARVVRKVDRGKSGCAVMVEVEQSTEPFAVRDRARGVVLRMPRRDEQPVSDALVIPLSVVVLDEFGDEAFQVSLTQRYDAIKTLTPDGGDEALSDVAERVSD
jgi:hypothetical protein